MSPSPPPASTSDHANSFDDLTSTSEAVREPDQARCRVRRNADDLPRSPAEHGHANAGASPLSLSQPTTLCTSRFRKDGPQAEPGLIGEKLQLQEMMSFFRRCDEAKDSASTPTDPRISPTLPPSLPQRNPSRTSIGTQGEFSVGYSDAEQSRNRGEDDDLSSFVPPALAPRSPLGISTPSGSLISDASFYNHTQDSTPCTRRVLPPQNPRRASTSTFASIPTIHGSDSGEGIYSPLERNSDHDSGYSRFLSGPGWYSEVGLLSHRSIPSNSNQPGRDAAEGSSTAEASRDHVTKSFSSVLNSGRDILSITPPNSITSRGRINQLRPRTGSAALDINKSRKTRWSSRESMKSLRSVRDNVMVNYIYQQALQKSYVVPGVPWQGIVLKKNRAEYACCPPQLREIENGLYDVVLALNVRCAMTVNSPVAQTILESIEFAEIDYVPLTGGLRVQLVETMADLRRCQLHHFAAFVRDIMTLVVWDDDVENLLKRAEDLEGKFVRWIWGEGNSMNPVNDRDETRTNGASIDTKDAINIDPGKLEARSQDKRRVKLSCAWTTAATMCLSLACMGIGWRKLAIEIKTDGHWARLALTALFPAQIFTSLVRHTSIFSNSKSSWLSAMANIH